MTRYSSSSSSSSFSSACRPVALPVLLLLLLLFMSSPVSSVAACAVSGDEATAGQHRPARRLLVSRPSTHRTEQWMWVGGEKRPFRNDAGASLRGGRQIPPKSWNPVHN